jgi:hypothetical protein
MIYIPFYEVLPYIKFSLPPALLYGDTYIVIFRVYTFRVSYGEGAGISSPPPRILNW